VTTKSHSQIKAVHTDPKRHSHILPVAWQWPAEVLAIACYGLSATLARHHDPLGALCT